MTSSASAIAFMAAVQAISPPPLRHSASWKVVSARLCPLYRHGPALEHGAGAFVDGAAGLRARDLAQATELGDRLETLQQRRLGHVVQVGEMLDGRRRELRDLLQEGFEVDLRGGQREERVHTPLDEAPVSSRAPLEAELGGELIRQLGLECQNVGAGPERAEPLGEHIARAFGVDAGHEQRLDELVGVAHLREVGPHHAGVVEPVQRHELLGGERRVENARKNGLEAHAAERAAKALGDERLHGGDVLDRHAEAPEDRGELAHARDELARGLGR
jgi:hypothetical protein